MAYQSSCIVSAISFFDSNQSRIVLPILIMPFDVNSLQPLTDLEPFDASKERDAEGISKHTAETQKKTSLNGLKENAGVK
jgi:hypothetical protein